MINYFKVEHNVTSYDDVIFESDVILGNDDVKIRQIFLLQPVIFSKLNRNASKLNWSECSNFGIKIKLVTSNFIWTGYAWVVELHKLNASSKNNNDEFFQLHRKSWWWLAFPVQVSESIVYLRLIMLSIFELRTSVLVLLWMCVV